MTYEQIKKANDQVTGIDVKGKEYVMVNQRIKAFRMVYPGGAIKSTPIKIDDNEAIFMTECFDEDGKLLATGHARELRSASFINKTSYIENCETSAVGRALGMCGFGIDTSVASAEEVQNAQAQQEQANKVTERDMDELVAYCTEEQIQKLLDAKGVANIEDLPRDYARKAITKAKAANTRKANKDGTRYDELTKQEETF